MSLDQEITAGVPPGSKENRPGVPSCFAAPWKMRSPDVTALFFRRDRAAMTAASQGRKTAANGHAVVDWSEVSTSTDATF